jgi:hypothetical protein
LKDAINCNQYMFRRNCVSIIRVESQPSGEKWPTLKGTYPENDGTESLRNVGACLPNCTASHPGSQYLPISPVFITVHNILRRTVPNAQPQNNDSQLWWLAVLRPSLLCCGLQAAGCRGNIQTFLFLGLTDRLFGWRFVVRPGGGVRLQAE